MLSLRRALVSLTVAASFAAPAISSAVAQSLAYIDQIGDYNRAEILQHAAPGSEAGIVQYGTGNSHEIEQRDGANQYARILVIGDDNGAAGGIGGIISQRGDDQVALVRSTGFSNGFDIKQSGDAGANVALLVQQGGGNSAVVDQTNTGYAAPGGSGADPRSITLGVNGAMLTAQLAALQAGTANASLQIQTGFNNTAEVVQNGQGNLAIETQIGSNNVMRLQQTGDGNSFAHTQIGNGNVLDHVQLGSGIAGVTVTQSGGSVAAVTEIR